MVGLQARIKKIMQVDDDVGKVAAAVPVIICIFWLAHLTATVLSAGIAFSVQIVQIPIPKASYCSV